TVHGALSLSGGRTPVALASCQAATSTTGLIQRLRSTRPALRGGRPAAGRTCASTPVVEIDTDFSQGRGCSGCVLPTIGSPGGEVNRRPLRERPAFHPVERPWL